MHFNLGGSYNTATGLTSIFRNIDGVYNTGTGYQALYGNTHGGSNTAIGAFALDSNKTGNNNSAFGHRSLFYNRDGSNNTASGYQAMFYNSSGNLNVANGYYSLYANTTGNNNTATGAFALTANTTAYYNTAIGYNALYSNTDQSYNTAIGANSLYTNTKGLANTAIGYSTLFANMSGLSNTGLGHAALYSNTTGSNNNAVARYALFTNTTGSNNNAFGFDAMYLHKTGSNNTAFGHKSLYNDLSGTGNTAMGYQSLYTNKTGNYNTALGYGADVSLNNLSNATAIGYNAKADASNKVVIGNTSVTVISGEVDFSKFSDGRFKKDIQQNVPGLKFINKLNPVTYRINQEKLERFLGASDSAVASMKNDFSASDKKTRTGFIAQEVEKVSKEINYDFDGVNVPQNENDNYSLAYADFVPSLVKAVQELSKKNDSKDSLIDNLQKQINELKSIVLSNTQSQNAKAIVISDGTLQQNIPNPFNNSTTINYTLPQTYTTAKIIITNKSGKTLKEVIVSGSSKGSITFNASALSSGTYSYSFYVDGRLLSTKQMILQK